MWLYPDGSRILEISTKCLPSEAFQAGAEFKTYLADRGIAVVASRRDEDQGRDGVLQGRARRRKDAAQPAAS